MFRSRSLVANAVLLTSLALAGCSRSPVQSTTQATPPPSAEDVLLGKPYTGEKTATPRGADGKPLLTGYWKVLRESGNCCKKKPATAVGVDTSLKVDGNCSDCMK